MRFNVFSKGFSRLKVDCLVVGVFDDGGLSEGAREIDTACKGAIARLVKRGDFAGRAHDTLLLTDLAGLGAARVLLVGQGSRASLNRRQWRRAMLAATTALAKTRVRSAAFSLARPAAAELDDYLLGRSSAELVQSALYRVNDQKTVRRPKPSPLDRVWIGPVKNVAAREKLALQHGDALATGQRLARDLGNLPGNICTPGYLAKTAQQLAKQHESLRTKILNEAAIRREKMGCFLAVTQGSDQPPKFIVIEYRGAPRSAPPIVLVGKGVTFDTGGISLKDPGAMDEMKYDMCGAAAVLGTIATVAELKLKLNVVALIPTCENMPNGRAVKPGDIAKSAAGLTVEILNTDAEGRLILCDALHYARRFRPAAVVDVATLTGACVIALGAHHSGVMGNNELLAQELVRAGVRADDRAWQLPLTEEYGEQLKSNFADFANIGGREGGAITAGAFLGKFTKGLNWAHVDIAGSAWLSGTHKGATGRPVALLTDFLLQRATKG